MKKRYDGVIASAVSKAHNNKWHKYCLKLNLKKLYLKGKLRLYFIQLKTLHKGYSCQNHDYSGVNCVGIVVPFE